MPRALSAIMRQALEAAETDEVFLALMKISSNELDGGGDPILPIPLRLVNNNVNIARTDPVDGPVTYIAFPFEVVFATEREDEIGQVRITIDNLDRSLVDELRQIAEPLIIKLELIAASDPDTSLDMGTFKMRSGSFDAFQIQAICEIENVQAIRYPPRLFNPNDWSALD